MENEKNAIKLFFGMWLVILAVNIAWWGFVIWVIIQLMQHFGVI
jgi:hypothetical protein